MNIALITALYSYTGIAYAYGLEWEGVTDFLSIAIGTQSEAHMITLTNHPNGVELYREQLIREGYNIIQINDMLGSRFNVGIRTIRIEGADTNNFYIQDDSCSNKELSYTGSGCTFYVTFSPSSEGQRSASIYVPYKNTYMYIVLTGYGILRRGDVNEDGYANILDAITIMRIIVNLE